MPKRRDAELVTVEEMRAITGNGDRWIVYDGDNIIFTGWIWELSDNLINGKKESELFKRIKNREVKRFKFHLEITHRKWKEKGLMKPLMPEETQQYLYSDLQESVFYEVHI